MKFLMTLMSLLPQQETEPIKVGDKAPDFKIKNHEGKELTLSEAWKKQWVVLAFYPKAGTPG